MEWFIFILIIAIIFVPSYIQYKIQGQKQKEAEIAGREHKKQCLSKYDSAKKLANLPTEQPKTVTIIEHAGGYLYYHWSYYVWEENGTLCLFPASIYGTSPNNLFKKETFTLPDNKYSKIRIPLDKIMFYRQIGDVYTTVTGSGGQSSFSPITGFHGKINPIEIKSEVHDERSTQLFYDNGTKDCVLVFKDNDYYTLKKIIPYKDYQVVTISEAVENQEQKDEFVRLEKINKLHEAGLISDEEYEMKKTEILNSI